MRLILALIVFLASISLQLYVDAAYLITVLIEKISTLHLVIILTKDMFIV